MSYTPQVLPLTAFGEVTTAEIDQEVEVKFPYNINGRIVNTTTTGSGTVTHANSLAVISTGAATSSSAKIDSVRTVKYNAGQGASCRFTAVFSTGVAGSTQEAGIGDEVDQFAFGYNGTDFGILRKYNSTLDFIAQTDWNVDKGDDAGELPVMDWTKGNVFTINYQWLGFGVIFFYVENPETGLPVLVHRIQYPNAYTTPSIFNPNLPLHAHAENTTNNTDIVLKIGSMGGFNQGRIPNLGPENSVDNSKTIAAATITNVITIRNKSTYAGVTNRTRLRLNIASYAADGNKPVTCRVIRNATLGGTPSWTDVDTNDSPVEYDIAGTTATGGQQIAGFGIGKSSDKILDLATIHVEVEPGDTITLAAISVSTSDIVAGITWHEEF